MSVFDRPTSAELLEAVIDFINTEIKSDSYPANKKFKFQIVLNVLSIVKREVETGKEVNDKLEQDKKNLSDRLGKHDLGNLAENKPGLVEKIINKASDSAARCMEIASGSPLTEEELNGKPNRECPSFWPSDNTTE